MRESTSTTLMCSAASTLVSLLLLLLTSSASARGGLRYQQHRHYGGSDHNAQYSTSVVSLGRQTDEKSATTTKGIKPTRKVKRELESNNNNSNIVKTSSDKKYRVIGGNDANRDEYKFYVFWQGCGASLISENVVLTAAHCMGQRIGSETRTLYVGAYSSEDDGDDTNNAIARNWTGLVIHPKYNKIGSTELAYDFALLVLDEPIDRDIIQPVKLNRNPNYPYGDKNNRDTDGDIQQRTDYEENNEDALLTVIGLGYAEVDKDGNAGGRPTTLQELEIPYVPHEKCVKEYKDFDELTIVKDVMLCAGGEKKADSCSGDSGGPILDKGNVQVGVVSFGVECGNAGIPAVYSRVSGAIEWIDEFICLNALDLNNQALPAKCSSFSSSNSSYPSQSLQQHVPVNIDIYLDDNPEETTVILRENNTDTTTGARTLLFIPNVVFAEKKASGDESNHTFSRTVHLSPGRYTLAIFDKAHNGMGGYKITSGNNVIEGDGIFLFTDQINFIITDSGEFYQDTTPTDSPGTEPSATKSNNRGKKGG